jgi:hypothetical protein
VTEDVDPREEPREPIPLEVDWRSAKRMGPPMGRDWIEFLLLKFCGAGWDSIGKHGRHVRRSSSTTRAWQAGSV